MRCPPPRTIRDTFLTTDFDMKISERQLLDAFDELQTTLSTFDAWWPARVRRCKVHELGLLDKAEAPTEVPVVVLEGMRAIDRSRMAYGRFELREGQAVSTALRVPGVIHLDDDDLQPAHAVNLAKTRLHGLVKEAEPSVHVRTRMCRRLFPGLFMTQVYRTFAVIEPPVARLSLTWSPMTISSTGLDRDQVLELLDREDDRAAQAGRTSWRQAIGIARRSVVAMGPGTRIRRRQAVAPHPRLTVHRETGRGARKEMLHANLPAIVSSAVKPVELPELMPFDAANRRTRRSDARDPDPILAGLGLYRT